jgi:DNA-binding GntR family transcriptional regulator
MEQSLYLYIAGQLRSGILSGVYKPEDMLPSENELAASYGTSRQTARKSLAILESEGLIKPRHGKGYFVQPPKHTLFTWFSATTPRRGAFVFKRSILSVLHPR